MGFLTNFYLKHLRKLERNIGCRLAFSYIPANFIQGWASVDMTKTWTRFGLNASGINYFTMGAVSSDKSTRFDPKSPLYQSWLGGYLVTSPNFQKWSVSDHWKLAEADQKKWLGYWYGDPNPECKILNFERIDSVNISGYAGELYECSIATHSDVGATSVGATIKISFKILSSIFNSSSSGLDIQGLNFIPHPSIQTYELVELKGYFVILQISPIVRIVLYANGIISRNNLKTDTYSVLKSELLKSLKSISILKT